MNELVSIISNLSPISPVLTAAVVYLFIKTRSNNEAIQRHEKKFDKIDSLKIEAQLSQIQTDLNYIKALLLKNGEKKYENI